MIVGAARRVDQDPSRGTVRCAHTAANFSGGVPVLLPASRGRGDRHARRRTVRMENQNAQFAGGAGCSCGCRIVGRRQEQTTPPVCLGAAPYWPCEGCFLIFMRNSCATNHVPSCYFASPANAIVLLTPPPCRQNPAFSAAQIKSLTPVFWEKAARVRRTSSAMLAGGRC